MKRSTEYKFSSFDNEKSILYHYVNEENIKDKESFIVSMSYLITLIDKHHPRFLFIQIFSEPHYFEDKLPDFMKNSVMKVIQNAGIKKVAVYIANSNFVADLKNRERNDFLLVRVFSTIDEAEEWFGVE